MKLQFKKRRLIPVALAILVLVVGSGVAYAYWTANGIGAGAAAAATGTTGVTVNQTTSLTGMYPGQGAVTLSGTFDNPNSYSVYVTAVTVAFDATTPVTGADGTCVAAANFALSGTAPVGHVIASGAGVDAWTGLKIQFINDPSNSQDGCKNATVHLTYTAVP